MRTKIFSVLALAALILAVVVSVSTHATVVANHTSGNTVDILSLTRNARDLPIQEFAAF
ncbi:MAG: hypothetical protein WCE79_24315 [Xanthobacteraceae bacterium]